MSINRYLIDTNIIIDYLRGRAKTKSFFDALSKETELLISVLTISELYAGLKGKQEEKLLEIFLSHYTAIPVDQHIAKKGGLIKQTYGPSHGTGLADAIIAATALENEAKLITLNLKHFPMVKLKEAPY